jgi:DNA polymerase-3 subunit gamma/tau
MSTVQDAYIVSARKYRPDSWETVVGQAAITSTLRNAISNGQIAQAYLFCGPRGVGKTTCARIFAKEINKSEGVVDNDFSFNIFELDAASNNKVDDIRSITEQVRIPPQTGKYKVYIIDEVHMLSSGAFNAFLKTLEEPPAHAIFILATTEKHKIIPTILSRCQIFDFRRITIEDMTEHLAQIAAKEGVQADREALHIIAQKADGALRDALSIFDQLVAFTGRNLSYDAVLQNLNVLDHEYYFKITDVILNENVKGCLLLFNEILGKGFDGSHFVTGLGEHFRNLLVAKDPETLSLLDVSAATTAKFREQAAAADIVLLIQGLDIISDCDMRYAASKNQRLSVELMLMKLASLKSSLAEKKKSELSLLPIPGFKSKEELPATTEPAPNAAPAPVFNRPGTKTVDRMSQPAIAATNRPKRSEDTLSLVELLDDAKVSVSGESMEDNSGPVTVFTSEQLEKVWNNYANSIREDKGPNIYNVLMGSVPRLEAGFEVKFALVNSVQERVMSGIRQELTEYLRRELHNVELSLSTYINQHEIVDRVGSYKTPEQILREMREKNPSLNSLVTFLRLDIEP